MRGDKNIIDLLNKQLTNELTAINQYFLHARMARHWGFERLGSKIYDESIGEMKHADKLIARILLLDGLPNLQALNKLQIGENVPEVLAADLNLERAAHQHVRESIPQCETAGDFVSRELLVEILDDTEDHIDWLETQLALIDKVGLQNYQQSMMGESDDD
jgi:bacterioferritin